MKDKNNIEMFQNNQNHIVNAILVDKQGLSDFQKTPNKLEIAIPKVGIERFRIPLNIEHKDKTIMSHDCEANMFINLLKNKKGANLSRFCKILQEYGEKNSVNNSFFSNILAIIKKDLRDFEDEDLIQKSYISLSFKYPVKQQSLKSNNWGWQYYDLSMEGIQENHNSSTLIQLTLKYEYSSTCPCSLSLAKQYEKDYQNKPTNEGNGVATAHSQRSIAHIQVSYDSSTDFHIEDLIHLMRKAIPTETQSLVKRIDEQAFAILNGENPLFIEDASRQVSMILNKEDRILDWQAKIEHIESLHSHNAVAYISKEVNLN